MEFKRPDDMFQTQTIYFHSSAGNGAIYTHAPNSHTPALRYSTCCRMLHPRIPILLLGLLLNLSIAQAQEIVKKKRSKDNFIEEYHVLKQNKDIRHGQSLTMYNAVLDQKYVAEFGTYSNSLKSGTWLTFYYRDPSNFLKSKGNYTNGEKEGTWRYYYPGQTSGSNVTTLFGAEKRTAVGRYKKDAHEFELRIDSAGQRISSTGKYEHDKKVGVWNYYSRSGRLFHRFDHTADSLVEVGLYQLGNDFLTFLGGPERFTTLYFTAQQEITDNNLISESSEAIYEVDKDGNYQLITAKGDGNFKSQVELILSTIPNEWVWLNAKSEKRLQIISKVDVNPNSFTRHNFLVDLKVVN